MDAIERYFRDTGDTPAALAQRIGRSPSTITRAIKGQRNPSLNLARDIERGSAGRLPAADFIGACLSRGLTSNDHGAEAA